MRLKLILVFVILFGLSSVTAQFDTVIEGSAGSSDAFVGGDRAEDNDEDGVCNDAIGVYRDRGINPGRFRCSATSFGDLCPGTPSFENAYTLGDRSGCSPSQLVGLQNYWSIDFSEMRPKILKANWLTDQVQGVKVYQSLLFVPNTQVLEEEGRIKVRDTVVRCDSGRGVVRTSDFEVSDFTSSQSLGGNSLDFETDRSGVAYINGNYGTVSRVPDRNKEDNKVDVVIKVNHQRDEALVRPRNVQNRHGEFGIDEIEFRCKATISQCREVVKEVGGIRKVSGCVSISPPEVDEFLIIVPMDSLAVQAPDFALESGIKTADKIVDTANSLIKPLEKFYGFVSGNCVAAVKLVLTGKILSFVWGGFNEVADFIWFGPEFSNAPGITKPYDSFILSGRSMCAAAVCPRATGPQDNEWCNFLNVKPPGLEETLGELAHRTDIRGVSRPVPIQDSLLLSSGCLCASGILANVYKVKAAALQWRSCLQRAKTTGEFVGECDRYLKEGICEVVIKEIDAWKGFDFLNIESIRNFGKSGSEETSTPLQEAGQAEVQIRVADGAVDKARDFNEGELVDIVRARGSGVMGYQQFALTRTFCSLALYQGLPDFGAFESSDLKKVQVESTTSSNFDSRIVYYADEGSPIFEYRISWSVLAGRDSLGYNVFLRNNAGAKRNIHKGVLRNLGDFASDFIEITDGVEYNEICFELPQEAERLRCYPPGKGSSGGVIGFDIYADEVDDRDDDGLPDVWEDTYNCESSRGTYIFEGGTDQDAQQNKDFCNELLNNNVDNRLNPDSSDSDGDGILDSDEDPDRDGVSNYQEYRNNGHPNKASQTVDGGFVTSACSAEFDDFEIVSGTELGEIDSISKQFSSGETVKIRLFDLSGNDELFVRTEIKGAGLFSENKEFSINAAKAEELNIYEIPIGDKSLETEFYTVKVQVIKRKPIVGRDVCRNSKGVLAEKTKKILIQNPSNENCIDSDKGKKFDVGGVCVDGNGVFVDTCSNGLNEYFCGANDRCVAATNACGDGNSCTNGACVVSCVDNDPGDGVGVFGVCSQLIDGKWEVFADSCVDDNPKSIVQYSCKEGQCRENKEDDGIKCTGTNLCQAKSLEISNLGSSTSGKKDVAVCQDKVEVVAGGSSSVTTIGDLIEDRINWNPNVLNGWTVVNSNPDWAHDPERMLGVFSKAFSGTGYLAISQNLLNGPITKDVYVLSDNGVSELRTFHIPNSYYGNVIHYVNTNGNGAPYKGNGNVRTKNFIVHALLEKQNDKYPMVTFYFSSPEDDFDNLFADVFNFLQTVTVKNTNGASVFLKDNIPGDMEILKNIGNTDNIKTATINSVATLKDK